MKTAFIDVSKEKGIEIPIVFSKFIPDYRDYIAYIRMQLPDPWTRVYLKVDSMDSSSSLLETANIFCYTNEEELNQLQQEENKVVFGIDNAFLVITLDMLKQKKDENIIDIFHNIINSFMQEVNIKTFTVLLYFPLLSDDDISILNTIYVEASSTYSAFDIQFVYPTIFRNYIRFDTKNIDIVSYMDTIREARGSGTLQVKHIKELEAFVQEELHNGKNKISYSGLENFIELRYTIPYLYFKYKVGFVFNESLLTWICDTRYIYLYNRHSLYERLNFVQKLPTAFCLNIDKLFKTVECRLQSYITPDIVAVYNFETCEEVNVPVNWKEDTFIDFRQMFIDKEPLIQNNVIAIDHKTFPDYETDKFLVDKFIKMDIQNYITIKNSILMKKDDILYLVYTKGDFSLETILQIQNVIPNCTYLIKETDFHRIYTHPVFNKVVGEVNPAYSIDVRLLSLLFYENPSMLSYYERALRWCKTFEDNSFNILEDISLETVRNEPTARYFLSCFGNPINLSKQSKNNVAMLITNKIMEGKKLP